VTESIARLPAMEPTMNCLNCGKPMKAASEKTFSCQPCGLTEFAEEKPKPPKPA
jgi:DNA-directed RNA polymerase subunit RPC12/RpoP